MTRGPDACANRSFAMVRLATPAVPPASAVSRKLRREMFLFVIVLAPFHLADILPRYTKIAMDDFRLRLELMRGSGIHDSSLFHQEHAWAQLERRLDVLLNQQDRDARLVDPVNLAPDLRHQTRHDALGRLVED